MTTIHVCVDVKTAIERNIEAGWHPIGVDTTLMSEAEREELRHTLSTTETMLRTTIAVGPNDWPLTGQWLRAKIAERVARRAAEQDAWERVAAVAATVAATLPPCELVTIEGNRVRVMTAAEIAQRYLPDVDAGLLRGYLVEDDEHWGKVRELINEINDSRALLDTMEHKHEEAQLAVTKVIEMSVLAEEALVKARRARDDARARYDEAVAALNPPTPAAET